MKNKSLIHVLVDSQDGLLFHHHQEYRWLRDPPKFNGKPWTYFTLTSVSCHAALKPRPCVASKRLHAILDPINTSLFFNVKEHFSIHASIEMWIGKDSVVCWRFNFSSCQTTAARLSGTVNSFKIAQFHASIISQRVFKFFIYYYFTFFL